MGGSPRWIAIAIAASACGRFGFDPVQDAAPDAEPDARGPFVLGPTVQVSSGGAVASEPAIAWTGERYLIAWRDSRAGNLVYVGAVDRQPSVIAEGQISEVVSSGFASPSVAWTGSELGVEWRDDRNGNADIYFSRVDADGRALGPNVRITLSASVSVLPSLVWTGGEFATVYTDDSSGNAELAFARLAFDGTSLSPPLQLTTTPGSSARARLARTALGYAVTWDEGPGIWFGLVSPTGVMTSQMQLEASEFSPAIAWNGSAFAVAHSTSFDGIQLVQLDAAGGLGPKVRVDDGDVFPSSPRIVWTSTGWAVVWIVLDAAGDRLRFALFDPSGARIGTILDVAIGPEVRNPDLVWAGDHFGITWSDRPIAAAEIFFRQLL